MTEFLCKTRGEHNTNHRARVYFTFHPDVVKARKYLADLREKLAETK